MPLHVFLREGFPAEQIRTGFGYAGKGSEFEGERSGGNGQSKLAIPDPVCVVIIDPDKVVRTCRRRKYIYFGVAAKSAINTMSSMGSAPDGVAVRVELVGAEPDVNLNQISSFAFPALQLARDSVALFVFPEAVGAAAVSTVAPPQLLLEGAALDFTNN